jgi:hypothetical protein
MAVLKDIPGFEVYTDTLQNADLHTLHDMPESVQQMWRNSTTGLPLLLPSKACWRSAIPSFEKIFTATSKQSKIGTRGDLDNHFQALTPLDSTVFERGEQVKFIDPMVAFSQLVEPNSENPMCVIGLKPPSLVDGTPFRAPPQLLI